MSRITARHIPFFALLLSGGLLCGAWFFQYGLGYAPCTMCYWQRHAHKAVLGLAVIALILAALNKRNDRITGIVLGLAVLGSFAMAFWHMGVEYKWWEGPATCAASGAAPDLTGMTYKEIMEYMNKAKPPSCSEAVWHFLGLSMAGWNAGISLLGAFVCFWGSGRTANV